MMQDPPRSATTRQKILSAAHFLLSSRSMRHVQLKEVARHAGVSSALIIFYFKSKEDLFVEAHLTGWREEGLPIIYAMLEQHPGLTTNELALRLFEFHIGNLRGTRDLMSLSWWWSEADEEIFQQFTAPVAKFLLKAILREADVPLDSPAPADCLAVHKALIAAYSEVLRVACVRSWTVQQAIDAYTQISTPLLAMIKRGAP